MTETMQRSASSLAQTLEALNAKYDLLYPEKILEHALSTPHFDNCAVVSSFGAESAVLLHMVAQIRPDLPVLFIDTGKLFGETLRYRDTLQQTLGLEDVRIVAPRKLEIMDIDPDGTLNRRDPDACCEVRKVSVLKRALSGYTSWISGRKRFQSTTRAIMPIIEFKDGRVKLNPLANSLPEDLNEYADANNLPTHPLRREGYHSIGCFPCTSKGVEGDARSGRWQGRNKTECGIHL